MLGNGQARQTIFKIHRVSLWSRGRFWEIQIKFLTKYRLAEYLSRYLSQDFNEIKYILLWLKVFTDKNKNTDVNPEFGTFVYVKFNSFCSLNSIRTRSKWKYFTTRVETGIDVSMQMGSAVSNICILNIHCSCLLFNLIKETIRFLRKRFTAALIQPTISLDRRSNFNRMNGRWTFLFYFVSQITHL